MGSKGLGQESCRYPLPWDNRYNLTENLGLAFRGNRLVDLDAYVSQACGIDPDKGGAYTFGRRSVWKMDGKAHRKG